MTLTPPSVCPACIRPPRKTLRLRNGADLLQCTRCLLAWWAWPQFDPTAFYDRDYFQSDGAAKGYADYASLEIGVRRTARGRLRRIERLLPRETDRDSYRGHTPLPSRRMLEIGCGTGLFLDEAGKAGWNCEGIEVSEYAAQVARDRGLRVTCAPIEELSAPQGTYECVALWDVIEHVRDPAGVLRLAADSVRPGGLLALSTGDVTSLCARLSGSVWHLFNLPEHVFFFSPMSLRLLLERAGCEVARVQREVNWVPVSYLWERLAKPLGLRPPRRFPAGWLVPATLLDVVGIYAVRRPPGDVPPHPSCQDPGSATSC
jgi:SAM-dependent methyltransferase